MSQSYLSRWIKGVMLGVGVCGAVVYGYIVSYFLRMLLPDGGFSPWMGLLLAIALPCYIALYYGWRIGGEIGKDNSFSRENSVYLRRITVLLIAAAFILFVGNVAYLVLEINTPEITVISLIFCFVCAAVSVIAAALSHLVENAVEIRNENESYI